ncbi:MAG: hypothetical protein HQL63_08625 [Magnetococcales bacterium]|nr:hypothetical protein [Magnetococcales bacterium]MBF0322156.1 hypothetical protein [Magnetococcales bacterium]
MKFRETLDALHVEDPSDYTYSLGFATLFAMEGAWPVANIQAKRAYYIAERLDSELITGREAAYMRAITVRRSADHVTDLLRVRHHLNTARACLLLDLNRTSAPPTTTTALRFDAEDLALNVSAHMFHIFWGEAIPPELNVPPLEETENLLKRLTNSLTSGYPTENKLILQHVERKLITNLLMAVLLRQKEAPAPINPVEYQPWVRRLQENIDRKIMETFFVRETFLVHAILLAARCWTTENKSERKTSSQELARMLAESSIADKFRSMMPFDRQRFNYLRDFVLNLPPPGQ